MAIDTLLGLLSQSFNVFKKSIKTIIPVIILYTIIYLLNFKPFYNNNFNKLLMVVYISTILYLAV